MHDISHTKQLKQNYDSCLLGVRHKHQYTNCLGNWELALSVTEQK